MEKQFFDKSNGLWYELQDGNYYPCLTIPEEEHRHLGLWGRRYERYLREHRPVLYHCLVVSGKLHAQLVEIDQVAERRFKQLLPKLAKRVGATEKLKSCDPMRWVRLRSRHFAP